MSKLIIRNNDTYMGRPLKPEQDETPKLGFHPEKPPELIRDEFIESDDHRKKLRIGDGDISIIVESGTELGQIRIGLQYEGPKEQWDACLTKQSDLFADVHQWLEEIYKDFDSDFVVDIVSGPCPKGDSRRFTVANVGHGVAIETESGLRPGPHPGPKVQG